MSEHWSLSTNTLNHHGTPSVRGDNASRAGEFFRYRAHQQGIGPLPDRFCKSSIGALAALAFGLGPAAAQDFTAGKSPAQLFQSDCTACHRSPAGLAKGRDTRGLTSFLREHYTTKVESAAALAAYLVSSGPGSAEGRPRPQAPGAAGPNPNPAPAPAPKPRPGARSAEGEADTNANAAHEERRPARAPAAVPAARPETEETIRKLNAYAGSGGAASDTERNGESVKKLDSYAGAGSAADALTPADGAAKPKPAEKKKKSATSASAPPAPPAPPAAAHAPVPRRPPAPVPPRPTGNN